MEAKKPRRARSTRYITLWSELPERAQVADDELANRKKLLPDTERCHAAIASSWFEGRRSRCRNPIPFPVLSGDKYGLCTQHWRKEFPDVVEHRGRLRARSRWLRTKHVQKVLEYEESRQPNHVEQMALAWWFDCAGGTEAFARFAS